MYRSPGFVFVMALGTALAGLGTPAAHAEPEPPGPTIVLPQPPPTRLELPTATLIPPTRTLIPPLTVAPSTTVPVSRPPVPTTVSGVPSSRPSLIPGTPVPPGQPVSVRLLKKDRISGALLPGAVFSVMPCRAASPVQAVTTAADGAVVLALPAGCWRAVETRAPAGYTVDTAEWFFTVAGQPLSVSITNTPANYSPPPRDPDKRVPLSDVPSGPAVRSR